MALKLKRNYKGIDADYWKITAIKEDYVKDTTLVRVHLYISQDARLDNINNYLPVSLDRSFSGVNNSRAGVYKKLKEPNIKFNPHTQKEEETNIFVAATDV